MRKGKSLVGMKVIGEVDGADLGNVKDLVFDHDANESLALLMSEKDLFGLIDAQIVPWSEITHIGPDAITVASASARKKAGEDSRVRSVMNRDTALSGTRIYTTDGEDLGTLADAYLDDKTGQIQGYEISGGFVSDTMTGKRFLPADHDLNIGKDVALVEPDAAHTLETQKTEHPGGITGATQAAGEKAGSALDAAKEKVGETYGNIAHASVEKQKEFVIGKTAGRDVVLPAEDRTASSGYVPGSPPADTTSSGEVVDGEVLVRQNEEITAQHADRAEAAEVLGQLVASAIAGSAGQAYESGRESASGAFASGSERAGAAGAGLQDRAENAVIGKVAAREVSAPDGSTIVAEGQTVTQEVLDQARVHGKEREVIAVAGMAVASQGAQDFRNSATETAENLWETAKQKVADLTHSAEEKRAEYEKSAEQSKINHALGRPTTRVILDQSDKVILNTGDIITHAAVDRSREAGVLEVLLSSVYDAEPEITPEMMRAQDSGEASLAGQQEPSGGPITATVAPETTSQDVPSQDLPR